MTELLKVIEAYSEAAAVAVLTVLEGPHMGEKAILADGKMVWKSVEDGFFAVCQEEAEATAGCGSLILSGTWVFCDTMGREKQLVICGGGHISMPLIHFGVMMGYEVTVLEDRPLYADRAREAGATRVLCMPFEEGLKQVEGNTDAYFVIVTRGHRYDQICLEKIIQKEHAYIGMIGSRRRVALVKEKMVEQGCDKAILDTVYTPIGLAIGAETPVEISISIIAEIIEVKNRKKRTYGFSREILKAIKEPGEDQGRMILATIVKRKGSAPQGVGAKMLICQNGRCVGTIGGGCMEARVTRRALVLAAEEHPGPEIFHGDLTESDAEEDGMVCGGVVDILLEVV